MTSPQDPFALPSFQAEEQENVNYGDSSLNQNKNTLPLVGLIVSLVSIPAVITILGGFIGSIIGIILSIIGMVKAKNYAPGNGRKGLAIAGLIVGIIALILSIFYGIFSFYVYSACGDQPSFLMEQCVNDLFLG